VRVVYADAVLIMNFAANFTVLSFCSDFMGMKKSFIRLAVSSSLGAVFALFCAVANLPAVLNTILGFGFSFVMGYAGFGYKSKESFIKLSCTLYFFSFLLCGVLTLISNLNADLSEYRVNELLMIVSCFLLCAFYRVFSKAFESKLRQKSVCLAVFYGENSIKFKALCDTGCTALDTYTGLPVITVTGDLFEELINNRICDTYIVPIKTVSGMGKLRVMIPDRIVLNNTGGEIRAVIGTAESGIQSFGGYQGLVPASLIEKYEKG